MRGYFQIANALANSDISRDVTGTVGHCFSEARGSVAKTEINN